MLNLAHVEPIDYLVVGHLSQDQTPEGLRLGGTVAFSALTARILGLRVGIVTSWNGGMSLDVLKGIQVVMNESEHNTTFENVMTPEGRIQHLYHRADPISLENIPEAWRHSPIIHIGPIAQEVDASIIEGLHPSLLGLTPQGWMRTWDENGRVHPCQWKDADAALSKAGAVVISVEDVGGDEAQIEALAYASRVLVVTEGPAGARLYWNGDTRRFNASRMEEKDATGSGDIFAAAFFERLYSTHDPWVAASFATRLASFSVARRGLDGIPTTSEIEQCMVEVL